MKMPLKYVIEKCFCDRVAASKTYNKEKNIQMQIL